MSFRTIKSKRDYLQKRKSASWMYMSRLAAMKEYAFMKVLYENGFPVPEPIDQSRHCVVMGLIDAFPLRQIEEVGNPGKLYSDLMSMIVKLAQYGLIHGDFNEFNILIKSDGSPVLIDFPQMVSTSHINAEFYFNRDVECIRVFFRRRFGYESALYPRFTQDVNREFSLDVQVAASGFSKKMQKELEDYQEEIKDMSSDEEEDDDDDDDNYEEEGKAEKQNELSNDIPEMTEEQKMEEKLRNIRLGNTEPTSEEESEEEVEQDSDDDEENLDDDEELDEETELARRSEKIEKLNNRDFKAHRDVEPKKTVKKSGTAAAAAKEIDVKNKVARTLKSQTNRQNIKNTRGNNLKNKGKRRDQADCRGGGIFD